MLISRQGERERRQEEVTWAIKAERKPGHLSILTPSSFSALKKKNKVGAKVHTTRAGVNIELFLLRIWALFPSWQESGWFLTKQC